MPRTLTIVTLWTAAWEQSNMDRQCPGEHLIPGRPDVHYVITRRLGDADATAYLNQHGIRLQPGQVLGAVPQEMSPNGYLISTAVTTPAELSAFAALMADNEQLGTVPAADRPAILLTAAELGDLIDEHYRGSGDVLFHREGLPWYDVPSQNADRESWLIGHYDEGPVRAWTARLADERDRGMESQRLRYISEQPTDDELMSLLGALKVIGAVENVRIIRRSEHPTAGLIDHDYWIVVPAGGDAVVIRSHYTDGGAFRGAEVIPPHRHAPYLRDAQVGWAIGVPYADYMAAHPELHRRTAA